MFGALQCMYSVDCRPDLTQLQHYCSGRSVYAECVAVSIGNGRGAYVLGNMKVKR
ncbi:hypothetical protein J6590_085704, partial [Homalodisca vitripennis]